MLETGAEGGDSIATGQKLRLSPIVSCEILPASYERVVQRFVNSSEVRIWLGHSVAVLPEMLQVIAGHRTLFWLDAHLPDIRNPQGTYSDEEVMPLRAELETILRHRDCSRDVILIDDLVLFDPVRQDADWLAAAQRVAPRWKPDLTLQEITALFPGHRAEILEVNRDGVLALVPTC